MWSPNPMIWGHMAQNSRQGLESSIVSSASGHLVEDLVVREIYLVPEGTTTSQPELVVIFGWCPSTVWPVFPVLLFRLSIIQQQATIHDSEPPRGNSRDMGFPTEKCPFLQKHAFSCRKMHFSRGKLQETAGNCRRVSGLKNQER